MSKEIISIKDLNFNYSRDSNFNFIVDDFKLDKSETLFVEGESGSGKTTFLNLLTGLIEFKKGEILILGQALSSLSRVQMDQFRAKHFGMIAQMFNLISYLTGIENILMANAFNKDSKLTKEDAIKLCLELDISDEIFNKKAQDLSIGQQQRIAIARALITEPEIIIADEPTSALDQKRKDQFVELLFKQCKQKGCSLLFVSHDTKLKDQFDRRVVIKDGYFTESK
tara:strand:- start:51 stop:728 length:678 start_codon:yes stop_codon:yes gene_type:complete